MVTTTQNSYETSVTVTRPDSKIDFCHVPSLNEVIIGETIGATGDEHQQIVLSLEEARELQSHLNAVL